MIYKNSWLVVGVILLVVTVMVAQAIASPNYNIPKIANEGGGAGGSDFSTSSNYLMASSLGDSMHVAGECTNHGGCKTPTPTPTQTHTPTPTPT